ncbi:MULTISPECIES: hypothetical protein [Streptomyces]|uniref:hypothetical protein n=1 Tax=Streptomyces TaxID=1883 RepID=UPI00367DC33F
MGTTIAITFGVVLAVLGILAIIAKSSGDQQADVVRARTGVLAVIAGNVAILGIALWGAHKAGDDSTQLVAMLTSAFTAISAITTSFFGIRAVANTAARVLEREHERR